MVLLPQNKKQIRWGVFQKQKTHQYLEYTDDQEGKLYKDENALLVVKLLR